MASDATLSEARQGRHTAHGLPKKPPAVRVEGPIPVHPERPQTLMVTTDSASKL